MGHDPYFKFFSARYLSDPDVVRIPEHVQCHHVVLLAMAHAHTDPPGGRFVRRGERLTKRAVQDLLATYLRAKPGQTPTKAAAGARHSIEQLLSTGLLRRDHDGTYYIAALVESVENAEDRRKRAVASAQAPTPQYRKEKRREEKKGQVPKHVPPTSQYHKGTPVSELPPTLIKYPKKNGGKE